MSHGSQGFQSNVTFQHDLIQQVVIVDKHTFHPTAVDDLCVSVAGQAHAMSHSCKANADV